MRCLWCVILGLLLCVTSAAWGQSDVADVRSQRRAVGGDERQSYFLINAHPDRPTPKGGFGLVVVLPGGPGSADFNPFVKRIAKHAAPADCLVVQLVAHKWAADQQIVWPTYRNKVEGQKFTTEQFAMAAIDEVRSLHEINPQRIYAMGWSSSGMPVYSMVMKHGSVITGGFVSQSVFKPDQLPPMKQAKGRAFYIEHAPDDRVCPYRLAELARDTLKGAGANVKFAPYRGGHGWRVDVWGRMRRAFTWLEKTQPDRAVGKKGLGITLKNIGAHPDAVAHARLDWYYNWGLEPFDADTELGRALAGAEFVPMIWGKWGVDKLDAVKRTPGVTTLLGYNEPDKGDQANMTVDEAIEHWPKLEATGLRLGSPACVNAEGEWMRQFMKRAAERNLRIDFVCVHWYGGKSGPNFIAKLERIHKLYNKPIWVTEFCPANWDNPEKVTVADQVKFMRDVLPRLERLDYVERYAWFTGNRAKHAVLNSGCLHDDEGKPTPPADEYRKH